jgi:putative alpha-1,2-mannosidase
VDDASAHDVLERELGTADIATLMARTRRDWDAILTRVGIDDADDKRRLFYTCLFRVLQMPARLDDAQGRFRTPDGALHQASAGHHRYGGWSLWDNYRTQVPLVALVAPEVARDMAASLVDLFASRKAQWAGDAEPFLSVRTEHAGIALLDLARKGLAPADLANALPPMAREADELPSATPDQRLELAYDEWAIAQLAHDLGQKALAERFTQRWQAYRPLWQKVFEPLGSDADTVKARGLYQGTLWQYRWAPVFDLPWLRDTALGRERFAQQLGTFFDRKLFNMTNEPDIQAPFLFALAGQPERADALVAALRDGPYEHWYDNQAKLAKPFIQNSFSLSPGFADGMDDDGGAMSAWYVWASLGLYPMVPGEPWYVATLPGVRRASLSMEGHTFTILRHGTGERAGRLTLDGRALPDRRVDHAALVHGGTLSFDTAR